MDSSQILVFSEADKAVVKILGKGSFQNAHLLKSFYTEVIPKGALYFYINLQECSYLDSTFLGTLALLGSTLRKKQGKLFVVNASPRNLELMQNLGLDRIFTITSAPLTALSVDDADLQKASAPSLDKTASGQQMLEAHEMLIEIDSRNLAKFKDVVAYLREDLESH